ncbi:MAG TPA: DUF3786 domain-containing protein [Planctomycetota bacterium]|nr:DUF3786 domain-containing protein [Planctomycetota bacterium]
MPEKQDPIGVLWERLQGARPDEVVARGVVAFDAGRQAYLVPLCGTPLYLLPGERRAEGAEGAVGYEAMLVCLQYLLTAQEERPANEWVDPKSLPYGDFFFRGPHPMPTAGLEKAFGERLDAFRKAAERLGGRAVAMGDAAYVFAALPRVPVVIVLWAADDEFPARAKFLLDRHAHRQLPLDALWVLCRVLAKRLVAPASCPWPTGETPVPPVESPAGKGV